MRYNLYAYVAGNILTCIESKSVHTYKSYMHFNFKGKIVKFHISSFNVSKIRLLSSCSLFNRIYFKNPGFHVNGINLLED